ncbi:MAG: alpha/beta hydrolase [Gemmatimonadota bacterium]|jgi:acetyl esterase/lipase
MRKPTLVAALVAVFALPIGVHAQARDIVPDVVYGHKDGMALTFDVFEPASPNGAGILYMVSGGWFSRYADPEGAQDRYAPLLDAGFTVFAVRHGSAPRYHVADAVDDVTLANRYIHAHAADWGVDASRLGVTGGSAGGHLSLVLGNNGSDGDPHAEDPLMQVPTRMAAVVAYYPPVDVRQWRGPSERFPALDFPEKDAERISPILQVSPDDPPTLLIHGTADPTVPISHSERAYAAFQEAGVETDYIVMEGAGHGFRGEQAEEASAARVQWFEEHLLD